MKCDKTGMRAALPTSVGNREADSIGYVIKAYATYIATEILESRV
jgi:hypothetical protein